MLERALAYAELGWAVFPLIPNSKRPLTQNGFKDASKDPEVIRRWWLEHPTANIGLVTGEISGLVVVDVDVKNGAQGMASLDSIQNMTPTLTVQTPSGGLHFYYLAPGTVRCRTGLLPGIDIKADGGYVVAPGSQIDGKPYEWLDAEAHIAALPDSVIALLDKPKPNPIKAAGAAIPEGLRNSALASIAGTMRRRNMLCDEIVVALKAVNNKRCQPPLPDAEVETIAQSICKYQPESSDETDDRPVGFTDDALALRFSEQYAEDWRYVAAWGYWLHWDGKCWRRENTLRAFDLARLVCREAAMQCEKISVATKVASANAVAAVERLARADRRHAATTEQWDSEPWLLNGTTGIVDLRTGQVMPHDRTRYSTKMAAAGIVAGQGQPARWLAFLNDVTDGDTELQGYLARMAGYMMTGNTSEHALFFLYGTGANGKSVFVNTLAAVLGDYATNAPIDTFMETKTDHHPTDVAGLRGARLVTAIEVEKGRRWAEAKIKSLTGGDKICARFMRQDFFEYKPQFKLLIAGNNKPSIREVDEAMKRRLHLIPFTVTIPASKRDHALSEHLLEECDGILKWALDGCLEWQRIGLKPPTSVMSATEEYLEAEDALGRWLSEECVQHSNSRTPTDELYQSWKAWTEKWGEYTGTLRKFSDDLYKRGFDRSRSSKKRFIQGLALNGDAVQEDIL